MDAGRLGGVWLGGLSLGFGAAAPAGPARRGGACPTMRLPDGAPALAVPGRYRLRLPNGRDGPIQVTNQAHDLYTIEGVGELKAGDAR